MNFEFPHWLISMLIAMSLLQTFPAFAQEDSFQSSGRSSEQIIRPFSGETKSRGIEGLTVGYEFGYFNYKESGLMQDFGAMSGVRVSDTILVSQSPLVLTAEGDLLYGSLTYDGQTWQGAAISDSMVDYEANFRGLLGVSFGGRNVALVPYAGLGLRYLNDNGNSAGSYEREVGYLYLPVGVRFRFEKSARVRFGISAEFDQLLLGKVKSFLSETNPNNPDVVNTQTSGDGFRVAVSMDYQFVGMGVRIEPYWQHWSIGNSDSQFIDATHSGMEPANISDQLGFSIQIEI